MYLSGKDISMLASKLSMYPPLLFDLIPKNILTLPLLLLIMVVDVRATLMTRPHNNNNKANIYTKTIEWLYSWDPSESGNPKRSKLRI